MGDEVAVIEQDPLRLPEPLRADRRGAGAVRLDLRFDLLGDGADLAVVAPAGDDEGLGDGENLADLEDDRLFATLGGRRPGRGSCPPSDVRETSLQLGFALPG